MNKLARCTPFETQRGSWTRETHATALGRTADVRHMLASPTFRQHDFVYHSVPWIDYAECGDKQGYAWSFQASLDSCNLPSWPRLYALLQQELRGKTIVFAGDSVTRQLYGGFRNALIMQGGSKVNISRWGAHGVRWAKEAERATFHFYDKFHDGAGGNHDDATPESLQLLYYPVYPELVPRSWSVRTLMEGNATHTDGNEKEWAWILWADVLVFGVGAFAYNSTYLEEVLRRGFDTFDTANHIRQVLGSPPLRLIWREYTPAHFPATGEPGAVDAPGEYSMGLIHRWMQNNSYKRPGICDTFGVNVDTAKNNFRFQVPARLLKEWKRSLNRSAWEYMPLFDLMWNRPDLHWWNNTNFDCRHWCQFSGAMDLWVSTLANALTQHSHIA